MKYYKLKTVAFYIFVATIMSFDLKGSENGNEVICPCCCSDEGKKKGEKEEGEEDTKDEKKKENKDEEKKEGEEGEGGEGGEGGNDGEGGREDEGEDDGEDDGEDEGEDEDEDDEKNFISELEQCFEKAITKMKTKKYVWNDKGKKRKLFIVNSLGEYKEILFLSEEKKMDNLFSYKDNLNNTFPLDNLSLISYCSKDENNKESKILELKMDPYFNINQVFEHFKNASTWCNKDCLILFIKDQDSNIVSLVSSSDGYSWYYTICKENN